MNRSATLISVLTIALGPWCGYAEAKPDLGKKLLKAALLGDTAEVQALLAQGAEPNFADKDGNTPLLAAVGGCGDAVETKGLLARFAHRVNEHAQGPTTSTPTEGRGSVEMVRALLGAGARPDVANPRGVTPLMYAAQYGRTESVRALLDAHADPNLKDAQGRAALHWAAREGRPEIVSLLVQRGAVVDPRTVYAATPLGLAASQGQLEVVHILLAAGADAKVSDKHGQTLLISAAYGGHVEVMAALVAAGVDVMARDEDGNTALSNAAFTGQPSAAAWLLDHGAEVNARAKDGTTALTLAKKRGHLDVAALLEARGGTESAVIGTSSAGTPIEVPERWSFHFDDREWHLGHQTANQQEAIREYVLAGQTVEDWKELVTSHSFAHGVPLHRFFEQVEKGLSRGCPSLRISVLEESSNTILFEWQHDGCQGYPAQHQIERASQSGERMLILSFVEKTSQLSPEKRNAWLAILKEASISPADESGP